MIWHRAPTPELASGSEGPVAWPAVAGDHIAGDAQLVAAVPSRSDATTACRELHNAVASFRAAHPAGTYSAGRTIDPLLDLWSVASSVDRSAARPIETILTALVERSVVSGGELASCIDRVEEALARLAT